MRRRALLGGSAMALGAAALGLWPQARSAQAEEAPASLLEAARALAAKPYQPNPVSLSPPFAGLNYDAYRGIRPIAGEAANLPLGDGYEVDLLPPGLFFPDPVTIEMPRAEGFGEIAFSPGLFTFEPRYFSDIPAKSPGAGFSGVRLRHPLNDPQVMDEVMVVQGASYFRAIGQAMVYGLSARAVALGTGGPGPEEFPRFTHLRLHRPVDGRIRMEAVIDSPSLAGHLELEMTPGVDTAMRAALTLLPRREITDVGVAPLTSMYLKGPIRAAVSDDFRPRVHDSDMLYIRNGAGEHLWRPISNPARIQTSAFADDGPVAFGLYQTPRRFDDYEDTEARYHDRPSARVQPTGDWGPGAVMLVEIPTDTEFMDNIVAFWRPDAPIAAGSEHRFDYTLDWTRSAPGAEGAVRIAQSRSGQEHDRPGTRRYVIDLDMPDGLAAEDVTPLISAAGPAQITGAGVFDLPEGRGARVTFLLTPGDGAEAVDLRVTLQGAPGAHPGPVWLHRWTPTEDGEV
ncbi:glucans biosynthesis protein [Roseovarius nanhaiticus]|uniref:Glucans biosynthesis protein n=1 Tax=Roseovarius nanhaiticus TaxID=573024 RepID=A0A1N7G1J7_9RHOB|nr:glucan biosynthesis protein [Roseovarius nanhaiticus]SEK39948.1 glucans biosynthesis protein [Roseovarius nanhaiticus]SIS06336.1 glucans biosynthesis protein [Roseovarius nanhaiticus]